MRIPGSGPLSAPVLSGLRRRVVLSTALVSALAMAAMIGAVVLSLNVFTRNSVDATLEARADTISVSLAKQGADPRMVIENSDDAVNSGTWLFDGEGLLLDGPRSGERARETARSLAEVEAQKRVGRGDRVYLARPVSLGGTGRGVLVVSENVSPYEATRLEIVLALVALGVVVATGATGIAAWTVARTLAPVEAMASLASEWSTRELDARFDDPGSNDEIAHLGNTLNVLLDRVAGALRGEQRLTSELAHELRTPLTALRAEAELGVMAAPDAETAARMSRLLEQADRMGRTITTLLDVARGRDGVVSRTSAAEVLALVAGGRPADERAIEVEDRSAGALIDAPRDLVVRALSPLVDNAVRHASTLVTVVAEADARVVRLEVTDDGAGLSADREVDVAANGAAVGLGGTGLGLPLARRVARTLGGEVSVTSPRSPTRITVTLPRAGARR